MEITTAHYVVLSALIFAVGLFGVVTRRNAVIVLMSLELMLNGANLAFVAFSRHWGNLQGQVFVFFVIAVAAAEARLGGARAFVMEAVTDVWDSVVNREKPTDEQRALLQIACSDAVRGSAEAVDLVAEAAGTSANSLDSPLERRARDVRVIRQHVTVAPHHLDDAGRVLLGLPPQGIMLNMV